MESAPLILLIVYLLNSTWVARAHDVLFLHYVIDNCFRKIFNLQTKDTVHECKIEFGVLFGRDVINIRKSKLLVKYGLSDNLLCQLCKEL